jgi:hypothetical protein
MKSISKWHDNSNLQDKSKLWRKTKSVDYVFSKKFLYAFFNVLFFIELIGWEQNTNWLLTEDELQMANKHKKKSLNYININGGAY